jgi:cellulose synthase/poly-beta-1,6-N-acetylglucosamine synthase-like glycosyltransferase
MSTVHLFLAIVIFALVLAVIYYYLLLAASIATLRHFNEREAEPLEIKFVVIIPAHNEELVIGRTVSNLLKMKYSQEMMDIVVIADNCDDNTAQVAREAGAICLEREADPKGRKGFAIAWYLERILPEEESCDALIIFDADSRPSQNFLQVMSRRIRAGATVLQGQHLIANSYDSMFTRMADIDMRINNRLRNLARSNLGLSCRLMGDAMCFERVVLERYPWRAYSLVEDREYGIQLLGQGIRIHYVPEATSLGQAAGGWSRAKSQRMRWTGGVLYLRRRFVAQLFWIGIRDGNLSAIDQAAELLMPPFSVLAMGAAFLLVAQILFSGLRFQSSMTLTVGVTIALILVPIFGLLLDRAPASLFLYVILGPIYAVWRIWINLMTLFRLDQLQWIRTKRTEER